jgi:hypothetical protein
MRPAIAFGLTGGFFSGSINNSLPPLLICFTLLGLETTAMTQILNLCFLVGKVVQGGNARLRGDHQRAVDGGRARGHGDRQAAPAAHQLPASYSRLLRRGLFIIALLLLWQEVRHFCADKIAQ